MEDVCFALPVLAGRTEDARAFMRELDGSRKADFDKSERRIGIVKECWFLQHLSQGDILIGFMVRSRFRLIVKSSMSSLIIVFEDLHWIDTDTQALLDLLADSIADARVHAESGRRRSSASPPSIPCGTSPE